MNNVAMLRKQAGFFTILPMITYVNYWFDPAFVPEACQVRILVQIHTNEKPRLAFLSR